jgi:predicted phage terminase large subunit-like protein
MNAEILKGLRITRREFDALARNDFQMLAQLCFAELNPITVFVLAPLLLKVAEALERVRHGEWTRLIINMPPRNGKSTYASVAFVAWLLGHNPSARIVCVSYSQDLADALARDCMRVMRSPWYRRLFPRTRISKLRQAVYDFETTAGGGRFATSIQGTLTGRGGDYIIIDDPLKPDQAVSEAERTKANEWVRATLLSRLNNKEKGAIVLVMQRLHDDDMTRSVQEIEPWVVVSLPARAEDDETHLIETPYGVLTYNRAKGDPLSPGLESAKVLDVLERAMGMDNFSAQYQQSPVPPGGGMIKSIWFPRFDPNNPPKFEYLLHSWDTAVKATELSDYSVCTVWGVAGQHLYLLYVYRKRVLYPELRSAVVALARSYPANRILIEDKSSGSTLIQDLQNEGVHQVTEYKPKGDKVMRLHAHTSRMEQGLVHLPPDTVHWMPDLLKEFVTFPKGKHDDQVDSVSQALDWVFEQGLVPAALRLAYAITDEETRRNGAVGAKVRIMRPGSTSRTMSGMRTGRLVQADDEGVFTIEAEDWDPVMLAHGWVKLS